tara:strand:+ start:221 stop:631 length:411 start_codon:yes stop_codon:yes gene_type:complete
MKIILFITLFLSILPSISKASIRIDKYKTNSRCDTAYHKAPEGSPCFKITRTNDDDPSVYILGRKYRDLESKKSKKPIPWNGKNASDGDSLTTYTLEIKMHWLENEARKTNGFKKLNWDERTYKLTNKGRHEFSKW